MSNGTPAPTATFVGYETEAGGKIVQEWYDGLSQIDREELIDTINYLLPMPVTEWRRPEFDKVDYPLIEIRCKSTQANHSIRMYGVFDEQIRGRIILLNGTDAKKRDKDKSGQKVALDRLTLLKSKKGKTNEFHFEKKPVGKSPAQQGLKEKASLFKHRQRHRFSDPGHKKR
jgi:hypothetical protein